MARILTLTANPAVDVSTSVERIEPVAKLRCRPERREAGGGGINVARVACRLGADAIAVFAAGGAIGRLLQQLVEKSGVACGVVEIAGDTRESFTVFDETAKKEYRFVLPGPTLQEHEWRACLAAVEAAAPGQDYLVASGSLPAGAPPDFYAHLARLAAATGSKLVVDASGPSLKAAFDVGVHIAKPNLRELEGMLGTRLADRQSQIEACRRLIHNGSVEILALTLGSDGALLVTRDKAWFADPLRLKLVSSVGAGDSFVGAMVWALASGRSCEDALRYGVAAGSATLLSPGTELCSRAEVERFVPEVKLTSL